MNNSKITVSLDEVNSSLVDVELHRQDIGRGSISEKTPVIRRRRRSRLHNEN